MLWKNCFSTQGTIFWQQCFLVCHGLNLLEQWSFTGGRDSSLAISVFLISLASFTCNITDIKLLLQSTDYTLTKLYLAQLQLHQINELIQGLHEYLFQFCNMFCFICSLTQLCCTCLQQQKFIKIKRFYVLAFL